MYLIWFILNVVIYVKKTFDILKKNKKNIILFTIILSITLFIYYLYYPGIITYDGNVQWNEILTNKLSNAHLFLSTYFIYLLSLIYKSPNVVIIYQILLSSFTITRIFNITRKEETKFFKEIILSVLISIVPIISIFTITLWKDIIFSYYLLNIAISLYKWKKNDYVLKLYDYIITSILLFAVFNYRVNGMIIVPIIFIYMLVIMKKNKQNKKSYIAFLIPFITLNLLLLIPKNYYLSKLEKNNELNIGTINSYMVWTFGEYLNDEVKLSKNDLKVLNNIADVEEWKTVYSGYLINHTNMMNMDKEYLINNQDKFRKIFIKTTLKNPISFIKHYVRADSLLLAPYTHGYVYSYDYPNWHQNESSKLSFISTTYNKLINFSVENRYINLIYMPANILYLSILLIIILNKLEKTKKYYIILIPMLANTISLLPINIAQDLRYVYINYLTLMFIVVLYINRLERKNK